MWLYIIGLSVFIGLIFGDMAMNIIHQETYISYNTDAWTMFSFSMVNVIMIFIIFIKIQYASVLKQTTQTKNIPTSTPSIIPANAVATIFSPKEIIFSTDSHFFSKSDARPKATLKGGANLIIPNKTRFRVSLYEQVSFDLEIVNGHTSESQNGFLTEWYCQTDSNMAPTFMDKHHSVAFGLSPTEIFTLLPGTKFVMIINGLRCKNNGFDIATVLEYPISATLIE